MFIFFITHQFTLCIVATQIGMNIELSESRFALIIGIFVTNERYRNAQQETVFVNQIKLLVIYYCTHPNTMYTHMMTDLGKSGASISQFRVVGLSAVADIIDYTDIISSTTIVPYPISVNDFLARRGKPSNLRSESLNNNISSISRASLFTVDLEVNHWRILERSHYNTNNNNNTNEQQQQQQLVDAEEEED